MSAYSMQLLFLPLQRFLTKLCGLARSYAIACFLLQAKDRHNGNILIDIDGHLVHIDFGFILEISPGGNMRFESAAFKLSHEMTLLVDPGGSRASREFCRFENLCVRGFLAVGAHFPFLVASQDQSSEFRFALIVCATCWRMTLG